MKVLDSDVLLPKEAHVLLCTDNTPLTKAQMITYPGGIELEMNLCIWAPCL